MKGKNKLPYNRWQICGVMETKRNIFFFQKKFFIFLFFMVCSRWYTKFSPLGIYSSNCICCFSILALLCFWVHIFSSFRYLQVFNPNTFYQHVVCLAVYVCGLSP